MSNRAHINNELQSVAPELVSIPVAMPYMLPQNYFSELAGDILLSIKTNEASEPLSSFSRANPYTVPTGYFDQFSDAVLQRLQMEFLVNQEEMILNTISRSTPYTVPQRFFEDFPATVLAKIKEAEQTQTVPTGYFESLSDTMLAKVRKLDTSKELDEVAPLLSKISKQPVQHVPTGYFENLTAPLNRSEEHKAPVITINKKGGWLKYAVAASIVLLMSFGAYFLFNNNAPAPSIANQPTVTVINQELASLDAATIENYLKMNNAVVQTALPVGGVEQLTNGNLDELLHGFTDQQLKEHIEETPELPRLNTLKSHI